LLTSWRLNSLANSV